MKNVIVVGGGIAGLTTAYLLKEHQPDLDVLVLEAQDTAGGNIKTLNENGTRMETGPHSFMGSNEYTWKLVETLGMGREAEAASPVSRNRYIYRHKKLKPLPMSPLSFIGTTLLSPGAKFRLMLEPIIRGGARDEDTAWDFFIRRFGKEAATYIMTPFISGVYAGDVNMLGARAAFNKFWRFEKESGSMIRGAMKYMIAKRKRLRREGKPIRRGLFSFRGGLGKLTDRLALELKDSIETGVTVDNMARKNGGYRVEDSKSGQSWEAASVVLAAPPPRAAQILKTLHPGLTETFTSMPMSPVSLIHWRVKDNDNSYPDGFGFLMPRLFHLRVLGTLFPSKLFTDRVAEGRQLFASFYAGMTDPGAMDLDDSQLTQLLFKEHKEIFRRDLEGAEVLKIIRYPGAIPQLLPDHPEKVERIREALHSETPGIFLAGNYLTGVGIEHAVESGFHASEQSAAFLKEGN